MTEADIEERGGKQIRLRINDVRPTGRFTRTPCTKIVQFGEKVAYASQTPQNISIGYARAAQYTQTWTHRGYPIVLKIVIEAISRLTFALPSTVWSELQ